MIQRNNKNQCRGLLLRLGLLSQLGLLPLLTGCEGEQGLPGRPATDALLRPAFRVDAPQTRSIVTGTGQEVTGGKINSVAVFVTKREDGKTPYPGVNSDGTPGLSVFKYDGTDWTGNPEVKLSAVEARVYAYSPSTLTLNTGSGTNPTILVDISREQSFNGGNAWECSVPDYLYGSGSREVGSAEPIYASNQAAGTSGFAAYEPSVYMQHALTQVVFTLATQAGRTPTEYDFVQKVTLANANDGGGAFITSDNSISIADGAIITQAYNSSAIILSAQPGTAVQCGRAGSPVPVAYGLIAPPKAKAALKLTVELNKKSGGSEDTKRRLTVNLPTTDLTWERGRKYIFSLTLSDRAISVSDVEIAEWKERDYGNYPGIVYPDGYK